MVVKVKQNFLLILLGLSYIYETQSQIFIVYPITEGITNSIKPKYSSRKLDSDEYQQYKNVKQAEVHIVYPESEDLVVMTPTPVEDYNEMLLSTLTEHATATTNDAVERPTTFMTTTDTPDRTTDLSNLDAPTTMATDIPEIATKSVDLYFPTTAFKMIGNRFAKNNLPIRPKKRIISTIRPHTGTPRKYKNIKYATNQQRHFRYKGAVVRTGIAETYKNIKSRRKYLLK